ncbi:condensation domain-containing protein [Pectobacterium brasiliense]|uniref:condensation domain-containing protein n=1 Tax=Pectobacterium brasiliense TaxID=180957 RepID=UPI0030CA4DEC
MREFSALYRAALSGHPAHLPPLPIQYADYAAWQRDWLKEDTLAEQRDFWHKQLQGAPALLELPTDRPRPAVQRYVGSHVSFHLSADVLNALKIQGHQQGTTLFMTVLPHGASCCLVSVVKTTSSLVRRSPIVPAMNWKG